MTSLESQQEPRILANFSHDENMINSYVNKKDLYAIIASLIYHNNYEDNLETRPDGSIYYEGKSRRTVCKSLLLGIMYGMGASTLAENIGSSTKEAEDIVTTFFDEFPKVKKWIDESYAFAREKGYVEDLFGRRRRLPDILLPDYTVKQVNTKNYSFNPLLNCKGVFTKADTKLIEKYKSLLSQAKYKKDVDAIVEDAKKNNISITNNKGFISRAERQCVNARVQGSAASMTKIAMKKVYNDEELNKLGFKLLLAVHDELIGECPEENAQQVGERLSYVMRTCIEDKVCVPFTCDASITKNWNEDVVVAVAKKLFKEKLKAGKSVDEVEKEIREEYSELREELLQEIVDSFKQA